MEERCWGEDPVNGRKCPLGYPVLVYTKRSARPTCKGILRVNLFGMDTNIWLESLCCRCNAKCLPHVYAFTCKCLLAQRLSNAAIVLLSSPKTRNHPNRSTLFIFAAVLVCVLVLCPLTGNPIACLLPLYAPISLNRLMFSLSSLRKSFSIFMFDSSAVMSRTFWLLRESRRAVGCMWRRARRCAQTWGPMP